MRATVRKDDGRGYREYLKDLAAESGTPTDAGSLKQMDRQRAKTCSNEKWESPHDEDGGSRG